MSISNLGIEFLILFFVIICLSFIEGAFTKIYYGWDHNLKDFKTVSVEVNQSAPSLKSNFYSKIESPLVGKPQWFGSQIGKCHK